MRVPKWDFANFCAAGVIELSLSRPFFSVEGEGLNHKKKIIVIRIQ
jgi:hypothetical protein